MQITAIELQTFIDRHRIAVNSLSESQLAEKPSNGWSKKEIIGHMVDSAMNNIRRFLVAQYEEQPKIVYNQDKWVAITGYQQYDAEALKKLWYLLNNHICILLRNMPPEGEQRKCITEDKHTLEWLAKDYILHLRHHLHQVLDLEKVSYP